MTACYVRNTGLVCPLGATAPTACAAIRCNFNTIEELDAEDEQGEPYYASSMPGLEPAMGARERVLALLQRTLLEAVAPAQVRGSVALFIALPMILAQIDVWPWIRHVVAQFESVVDLTASRVLLGDSVTSLHALAQAQATLADERIAACVVAASDSWVSPRRIIELERAGRLRRPDNPDGVIPGEAAACLLLDRNAEQALGRLGPPGFADEPATLWNDTPHRADGLVAAASAAMGNLGYDLADMDVRISDAAGESLDFREQTLLVSRLLERRKSSFPLLLLGASLGETGVAGPVCSVVKAIATYQRRYAAGPRALVCARDHDGPRGAVVVEAPTGWMP